MAFTQDDLTAINEAIASGVLTVRYRDRQETFGDAHDLILRRQLILDDLAATAGTTRKRITRISQGGTGYGC